MFAFLTIFLVKFFHLLRQQKCKLCWGNILEESDTNSLIVNYIMHLGKYFIFRSKWLIQIPVITVFHIYVKNRMVAKVVIATMNNKLNDYYDTWQVNTLLKSSNMSFVDYFSSENTSENQCYWFYTYTWSLFPCLMYY